MGLGGGTNRPSGSGWLRCTGPRTQWQAWFNTAAFAAPLAPLGRRFQPGLAAPQARTSIVGPGLFNWNISLFKSIPLTSHEGPHFEVRFESFNTFNHTEFQNIDTGLTDGAKFGQVTSTYDPRVMQFGGKFVLLVRSDCTNTKGSSGFGRCALFLLLEPPVFRSHLDLQRRASR